MAESARAINEKGKRRKKKKKEKLKSKPPERTGRGRDVILPLLMIYGLRMGGWRQKGLSRTVGSTERA